MVIRDLIWKLVLMPANYRALELMEHDYIVWVNTAYIIKYLVVQLCMCVCVCVCEYQACKIQDDYNTWISNKYTFVLHWTYTLFGVCAQFWNTLSKQEILNALQTSLQCSHTAGPTLITIFPTHILIIATNILARTSDTNQGLQLLYGVLFLLSPAWFCWSQRF